MADLQRSVGIFPATAVQGDFASTNPRATAVSNDGGFISDGTVKIGSFCWADGKTLSGTGTGAPLGFVSRNANFAYIQNFDGSTLTINKGVETTVHVAGDFYVEAELILSAGKAVFVSTTDGTIQTGEKGEKIDGCEETKFTVKKDASPGQLTIISTY